MALIMIPTSSGVLCVLELVLGFATPFEEGVVDADEFAVLVAEGVVICVVL